MSLEKDDRADVALAKTVSLGGKEFLIAPLTLRSVLALTGLMPQIRKLLPLNENTRPDEFDPLIDALVLGLKRVHSQITRDDLLDMTITIGELIVAYPVLLEQAGGRKADPDAGEQAAASDLKTSTGASSSPISSAI